MKYFLLGVVLALGLLFSASAESKQSRNCRIIYPERPHDAPKFAFLFDGKNSQRVNLPSRNFSEVIELPAGNLTMLMTPDKISNIKNLPPGVPSLKIAEDVRNFYILITADPTNPTLPIQLEMINISNSEFKLGETLWCNLTDHAILAKLGEQEMSVAPNARTVSQSPVSTNGYYRAEFKYQPKATGVFRKITEQQWWFDANCRYVGFIADQGASLPKIYFFRDFRSK